MRKFVIVVCGTLLSGTMAAQCQVGLPFLIGQSCGFQPGWATGCAVTGSAGFTNVVYPCSLQVLSQVGGVVYTASNITSPIHNWSFVPFSATSSPLPFGYQDVITLRVFGANGCTADSGPIQVNLAWDDMIDALRTQVTTANCATGPFVGAIIDNPSDQSLPITPGLNASYTLKRNGVDYQSGTTSSLFQAGPDRWQFSGLPVGVYEFAITGTASVFQGAGQVTYCNFVPPSTVSFIIPQPADCNVNLAVRACLEGPLVSTTMSDGLRTNNLIPTAEPYSALGYTYVGGGAGTTIAPALLAVTGADAIVDWVILELRDPTTFTSVVRSQPALLQRDGDVIGTDGDPYVSFNVPAASYRVAVRHRNHLGVMSGAGLPLATNSSVLDFRSSSTATYGTNAQAFGISYRALFAGDANGDGTLKYTGAGNDRDPIIVAVGGTTPNNTVNSVYDRRDTNLDGMIRYTGANNDRDIILTNIGGTTPTNTRTQQLP